MKAWNRMLWVSLSCLVMFAVFVNLTLWKMQNETISNDQIISIHRIYRQLQEGMDIEKIKLDELELSVIKQNEISLPTYLNRSSKRIILLPADADSFYRFEYPIKRIPSSLFWIMNSAFLLMILILLSVFLYIKKQILYPFHQMEDMADALKNRDFTYELPQQKDRFFGRFIWAIDIMKEELRHHEEKEVQLMKEKKIMIASLSHDIKTPLSNIRLYTDALGEQLYTDDQIKERIYENCNKIDQYVKEIMNTSNEDLFDFSVVMKEVYLHDVLDIFDREKERVELALVSYHQDPCKDGLIYTDIHRLREVVHNIIDNALKYGDGKWIHVSFYEEDHHHIINITNSGNSIDHQDINVLFQSFYRGNNAQHQKGNGLGLYICKQLMKQMDGDIFITQQEGSVSFHLVLGTL